MKEKCNCVSQAEYYEVVQSSAGHREERLKVAFQGFGSSVVGSAGPSCGFELLGGCSNIGSFTLASN